LILAILGIFNSSNNLANQMASLTFSRAACSSLVSASHVDRAIFLSSAVLTEMARLLT
jgi:hypothetical protein